MEHVAQKGFASLSIFKTRLDKILTTVVGSHGGTCFEQEDGEVIPQVMSVHYAIHICDILVTFVTAWFVLVQVKVQA